MLPLALGAADMTLMEQTSAFTTFPNDGVRVVPRYIRKVVGYDGRTLEENYPDVKDVISPRTARIMTSLLREVVLHGTGYQASKLKHPLAGKTGTTNDFTDAWFVGFSPSIACGGSGTGGGRGSGRRTRAGSGGAGPARPAPGGRRRCPAAP